MFCGFVLFGDPHLAGGAGLDGVVADSTSSRVKSRSVRRSREGNGGNQQYYGVNVDSLDHEGKTIVTLPYGLVRYCCFERGNCNHDRRQLPTPDA